MQKITVKYFFFVLVVALVSCNFFTDSDKIPLARVGDRVLYLDDLKTVIPSGLSADDSMMLAEDYIKKWVMNELLVKKAEENLSPGQKDLSKELMEYRNSMLTYRYKMELMFQKLDTVVSEQEISEYYRQHSDNFVLSRNIVKAVFIKIPTEVSRPEQAKVFCEQVSDDNLRELQEFCTKFATTCDVFVDNWVDLDMLLLHLPEPMADENRFLKGNGMIELRDKEFYYLLCVIDHRLANQVAPVEYVADNIKNLIINRRRIDFIRKIEEDVYLEGIRNNKFKLYSYEFNNEDE